MYKNMNISYSSKEWFDTGIHTCINVYIHVDGGLTRMTYWDRHICICDIPLTCLIFVCNMMHHMRDMLYSYETHHSFVCAVGQTTVLSIDYIDFLFINC